MDFNSTCIITHRIGMQGTSFGRQLYNEQCQISSVQIIVEMEKLKEVKVHFFNIKWIENRTFLDSIMFIGIICVLILQMTSSIVSTIECKVTNMI